MDRRFAFVGVGFGVLGLALGGVLVFVLKPPVVKVLGTDDSPVLARGGSTEFISLKYNWSAIASNPCKGVNSSTSVTNVNLSEMSMDGLELISYPSGPAGPKSYGPAESVTAAGLTSNWSIMFNLRDYVDNADSNLVLQLSTYDPCSGTAPGSGTIQGNTLYLADIGSKSLDFDKQNDETNDGSYRLHFDAKKCAGDGTKDAVHSRCNHISQVTVSGIPSLKGSSSGAISGTSPVPFQCRAGACDIGFDN